MIPDTRPSLILRIRDPQDAQAWDEFCQIYRQVVYQMAIARGFQSADADDLTQQILMSVSHAIERFEMEPGRAKFRTWLKAIAKNAMINALTRNREWHRVNSAEEQQWLLSVPEPSLATQTLELDYRRSVFLIATDQIRSEFQLKTWQAFWRTAVDDVSIEETARELNMTPGSIYAARCRVISRLRERVGRIEEETK
jgi:RNA polymerase sigma-70 factor, ECF subfamily